MTNLHSKRILLVAPIGQHSEAIEQALRARELLSNAMRSGRRSMF